MTRRGFAQGTKGKSREQLCAMITALRKENRRLRKVVGDRRKREKEKTGRVGVEPWVCGRPLREARLAVGWTMKDLAAAIGLPSYRISHVERGANRLRPEIARQIVAVFVEAGAEPPAFVFGEP